jgi:hypothetical protein
MATSVAEGEVILELRLSEAGSIQQGRLNFSRKDTKIGHMSPEGAAGTA